MEIVTQPCAETAQARIEPVETAEDYLSFRLADEEYGISIRLVQELRNYKDVTTIADVTSIAGAPPWVRGIMNLRGVIVPIIDLRTRLALDQRQVDAFTVVIILALRASMVGVVVDGVSDVINLADSQVAPVPPLAKGIAQHYLLGAGKTGEGMVLLLDITRMLAEDGFIPGAGQ